MWAAWEGRDASSRLAGTKGLFQRGQTPPTKKVLQKQRAKGRFYGIRVKDRSPLPPHSPKAQKAAHQNGDPVVIQRRRCVLDQLYPLGEEEEGKDSWESKRWKWLWGAWQKAGSRGVRGGCETGWKGAVLREGEECGGFGKVQPPMKAWSSPEEKHPVPSAYRRFPR